jgi:ankyrin repeat protein
MPYPVDQCSSCDPLRGSNDAFSIATSAWLAASFGGHEKVVRILLDKGADVNAPGGRYGDGRYGNALQAASKGGHEKVVRMLLDKNADVNAQGGYFGNALRAASLGGQEKVVRMLRDKIASQRTISSVC